MNVETRMARMPLTIPPKVSCEQALALMDAAEIDHLPVCDGTRLVGLISRDQMIEGARKLLHHPRSEEDVAEILPFVNVAGIMTLAPENVGPKTPLAIAARLMRERGFAALPVVEEGELVGILTLRDLAPSPIADATPLGTVCA